MAERACRGVHFWLVQGAAGYESLSVLLRDSMWSAVSVSLFLCGFLLSALE